VRYVERNPVGVVKEIKHACEHEGDVLDIFSFL
jgi:hypothetical protein